MRQSKRSRRQRYRITLAYLRQFPLSLDLAEIPKCFLENQRRDRDTSPSFPPHVGLIDPPGIGRRFEIRSVTLLQFGRVVLHPVVDGVMVNAYLAFQHHLFETAVAERVSQILVDAQQNEFGFEMTPFESGEIIHQGRSSGSSE